jgi:hypothetical protein
MARAGDLDWSNLTKGKVGEPEAAESRPLSKNSHKGGEKVTKEDLLTDANKIITGFLSKGIAQATDEQLFGHLVVSEEQIKKSEEDWTNTFNNFFNQVNKNVDNIDHEWGDGKSFNSKLSEQELAARNSFIDEDSDIEPA